MFRNTKYRSQKSSRIALMTEADLGAVVGGMFGRSQVGPPTPPIKFPPLPQTSFPAPVAPTPSPFSLTTQSSGGAGQGPSHTISASFDNGHVFASGQVITPAVQATPPLPLMNGNFTPMVQTHQFNAGFRFRF